jgi:RHS repeat-associated protein
LVAGFAAFQARKLFSGGPGYIGAIEGTFSVSTNGGAVYGIPLTVPPGTNKVQPQLALSYNSKEGNGMLGTGWQLAGLSEIRRVPATMAQDGFIGAVNYDSNDRFSLDGQRLMVVQGQYGADQAIYHTEIESWAKVVSYGQFGSGPDYFVVYTKQGYIMEYGHTSSSHIEATTDTGVRVWALNKITDPNGNFLTVTYQKDSANGSYYPLQIAYTGNADPTGKIRLSPQRAVQFDYETRPDVILKYSGGSMEKVTKRLSNISTQVDNKAVMSYHLDYQPGKSTGRSQLASITQTAADGNSLPTTTFVWQDGGAGLFDNGKTLPGMAVPANGQSFPMDINGDGLVDLVHVWQDPNQGYLKMKYAIFVASGGGFNSPTLKSTSLLYTGVAPGLQPADVNGDGLIDLIYAYQNKDNKLEYVLMVSNGSDFEIAAAVTTTLNCYAPPNIVAMDVNGDALSDLVFISQSSDNKLQYTMLISDGSKFMVLDTVKTGLSCYTGYPNLVPANINGDSMTDMVYAFSGSDQILHLIPLISKGSGFGPGKDITTKIIDNNTHVIPMDVNNDGLSDLVCTWLGTGNNQMAVFMSNGASYEVTDATYKSPTFPIVESSLLPMDINGDGLTDLMFSRKDEQNQLKLTPYISNGTNFEAKTPLPSTGLPWEQYSTLAMDINGDAKTDLVNIATDTANPSQSILTCFTASAPFPDLITSFGNGVGGTVTVNYKPLTDPSVYTCSTLGKRKSFSHSSGKAKTQDGIALDVASLFNKIPGAAFPVGKGVDNRNGIYGSSFPVLDIVYPTYVVADYTQINSVTEPYQYGFHYNDAKIALNGRGWLGFESKAMVDRNSATNSGVIATTHYQQLFPLTGSIDYSTKSRASDNALLKKNSCRFSSSILGNGIYQVLKTSAKTDYYNYGVYKFTLGQTYQYDDYGNPLVTKNQGDSGNPQNIVYTFRSFINDPLNWRFGLLVEQKITTDSQGNNILKDLKLEYYPDSNRIQQSHEWNDQSQDWVNAAFTYDDYGNILSQTNTSGDVETTEYDAIYHTFPSKKTTPVNQRKQSLFSSFEYEPAFGIQLSMTDANNAVTKKVIDGLGRVVQTLGPDPSNNLVTLSEEQWALTPGGGYYIESRTRMDWAGKNWHWNREYKDGTIRAYKTETLGEDSTKVKVTEQVLDSDNKILKESLPYFAGATKINWIEHVYDEYGRETKVTKPKGVNDSVVTQMTYPDITTVNILAAAGTGDSYERSVNYGYLGSQPQIIAQIDSAGNQTGFGYDQLSRLTQATDPLKITSAIQYDSLDQTRKITNQSYGQVTYNYDLPKRIVSQTDAVQSVTTNQYDALGRVINMSLSGGKTIIYEYDNPALENSMGRLSKVTMPDGSSYTYSYDAYGNVKTSNVTIDGKTYSYLQKFNPTGQIEELHYPDGSILYYTYTLDGYLKSLDLDDGTDGKNGKPINYATFSNYTATGKPQNVSYGNKVSLQYYYFPDGLLDTYRVLQSDGAELLQNKYYWNYVSQLTKIEDIRAKKDRDYTQSFTYDPRGWLLTANGIYGRKTYQYDDGANLLLKDGVQYSYHNYQATRGVKDGRTVFTAEYDPAGNMTKKVWGADVTTYQYDPLNRLTEVSKNAEVLGQFSYDFNGNRVKSRDLVNKVTTYYISPYYSIARYQDGTALHTKNIIGPSGNIATITKSESEISQWLTYHQTGLTAAQFNSHLPGGLWMSFLFKTNQWLIHPQFVHYMLNAILVFIMIICGSFFIWLFFKIHHGKFFGGAYWTRRRPYLALFIPLLICSIFITEIGYCRNSTAEPVIAGYPTEGVLFYIQDHINSTSLTTDAQGMMASRITYSPYGEIYDLTGVDNFRGKFGGKELDEESGLYYFGARYYDPQIARFITADTQLGGDPSEPGAFNSYAYALSNPIRYIDPSGHSVLDWIASIFTAAVEIAAGIAIDIFTEGFGKVIGNTLIGAGVSGLLYSVTHYDNFDWKDWGIQEGIGAVIGLATSGISAGIGYLFKDSARAATRVGEEIGAEAAQREASSALGIAGEEIGEDTELNTALKPGESMMMKAGQMEVRDISTDLTACEKGQCFVKGTLIATENGLLPIEDIKPGDKVWSFNQKTAQNELHQVVKLFRNETESLVLIQLPNETIRATPEHPFRVDKRGWVLAKDLRAGDNLLNLAGNQVKITRVELIVQKDHVYNFEVSEAHTYYVSNEKVLVHNVCIMIHQLRTQIGRMDKPTRIELGRLIESTKGTPGYNPNLGNPRPVIGHGAGWFERDIWGVAHDHNWRLFYTFGANGPIFQGIGHFHGGFAWW